MDTGLTKEEIIAAVMETAEQALKEFEDDQRIDGKESVLLAHMLVSHLSDGVDDAKAKLVFELVEKALKLGARFVGGDDLEP